jgi:O-antigen/teichoic acid export membrane protein
MPGPMAEIPVEPAAPPRRSPGRLSQLVGQSVVYGLGGTLARLTSVFLVPVYLAAAGTEAFGEAELVISAVVVAAIVLRLGIVNSMSRFTLAEASDGDWAPVMHTIFGFVLASSTAAAVVGVLLREPIAEALSVSTSLVLAGVLGLWITMNYDVLARIYRVERRASAFVAFQLANVAITVVLTILLVVVLDYGALGLLLGNFIGTGAILLAMTWARRHTVGVRRVDTRLARELLAFAVPLMPTNVAIWAINFADRLQVQRLASPEALGEYAAAAKVAAGMTLFLAAFQAAWTPFAHALRGEEGDEVAKATYAEVFTLWSVTMGWGLAALTLFSAPYIALTFPENTRDAAIPVVPLLAAAVVLYGVYLIMSIGVNITKKTGLTPVIAVVASVVAVGLNFWLIPTIGILGAALTTVIGFGLLAGLQWLNSRWRYPIPFEWGRVARVGVFTAAIVALSLWVVPETGPVGIAARAALAAAYPFGLVAIGAVSRDDLRRIPGVVRGLRKRRRSEVLADADVTP